MTTFGAQGVAVLRQSMQAHLPECGSLQDFPTGCNDTALDVEGPVLNHMCESTTVAGDGPFQRVGPHLAFK